MRNEPIRRRASWLALFVLAAPAFAGSIPLGIWGEFGFTTAGTPATGCFPDDPGGIFCIPSSGTPTIFLDAPPWTFTAPAGGITLTVTDAFDSGDRFEIFDFGASLGETSVPGRVVDCGDDPVPCFANPDMSKGEFLLGGGAHSITITPTLSPGGLGSAYLRAGEVVPEPSTLLILVCGMAALVLARRRQHIDAE